MDTLPIDGWRPGDRPFPTETGPGFELTLFPAPAKWATRGTHRALTWAEVVEMLVQPELWPGGGGVQTACDRLPSWTFSRYRDDTRVVMRDEATARRETALRVESVAGLIVEYDDEPAIDAHHVRRWWGDLAHIAYTTGFNEMPSGEKPSGPRWRVLVPFTRPVSLEMATRVGVWARHSRRAVGIVAEATLDVARTVEVPAIGPGGYRWCAGDGPLLEPDRAIADLADWAEQDLELRARDALSGTSLELAIGRFLERHHRPARHPVFPLPGARPAGRPAERAIRPASGRPSWGALAEVLGGVWPGRTVAVIGPAGAGRSAFVLQLAGEVGAAGHPVLVVLTRMGTDEVVARWIAARADGISASELLRGEGDAASVEGLAAALAKDGSAVHLWSPPAPERTRDELFRRIRATSDAHGGLPPLVVLDAVEGWAVDDPERGTREVLAALRDAAHGAVFGADWPGAGVVEVSTSAPSPHLRSADALRTAWERGELRALGSIADDAHVAIALATDPAGAEPAAPRRSTAVVARNRDGRCGAFELAFEPVPGRFRAS